MTNQKRVGAIRFALSVGLAAALSVYSPGAASSAMIPADLDAAASAGAGTPAAERSAQALEAAGLSAAEADVRARGLDATETAQLMRSDLTQQGGDGLIILLAVVGVIAIVLYLTGDLKSRR